MFDYADDTGQAGLCPLAAEVSRLTANASALMAGVDGIAELDSLETSALDWAAHVMEVRTEEGRTEEGATPSAGTS